MSASTVRSVDIESSVCLTGWISAEDVRAAGSAVKEFLDLIHVSRCHFKLSARACLSDVYM